MRTLVHKSLKPLSKVASSDETRPFLCGVHVYEREKGGVVFEATDGGSLLRIIETTSPVAADFPTIPGVPESNGKVDAIIPTTAWEQALGSKVYPRRGRFPILENALLVVEETQATFAATNLDQHAVLPTKTIEGRYPACDTVFPTEKPTATVHVDASRLAELLQVMAETVAKDGTNTVRIDFYGDAKPLRLSASDGEGRYKGIGLMAPLRNDSIEDPADW
jgi:DNA polymerase III sliding clamp (beta) subunit (PCNA family)